LSFRASRNSSAAHYLDWVASSLSGLEPCEKQVFLFREIKDYRMQFFSRADFLVGDTVWDILSREGYRCFVMNVPMTYPAKPLNGALICSFDSTGPKWAYPDDAKRECIQMGFRPKEKSIGDFKTYGDWFDYWVERETLVKDVALHFIDELQPDFAFVTFLMLDRLGHRFAVKDPITYRMAYAAIDKIVGDLISKAAPEHFIIASDHGIEPASVSFSLNTWLWEHGYLKLKSEAEQLFRAYASQLEVNAFDFNRTVAWSAGQGSVILNDSRFNNVAQNVDLAGLIDELKSEVDPHTGQCPFAAVLRRSEVWNGPYLEDMPDLIVLPNIDAGYFVHWVMMPVRRYTVYRNGEHGMDGFYLLSSATGQKRAHILQIAPTILKLMDVQKPSSFDMSALV